MRCCAKDKVDPDVNTYIVISIHMKEMLVSTCYSFVVSSCYRKGGRQTHVFTFSGNADDIDYYFGTVKFSDRSDYC